MTAQPNDFLDHVNPTDFDALTILLGNGLPVVRVTRSSPEGVVNIVWRNPPSDDDQAEAVVLIGPAAHSW